MKPWEKYKTEVETASGPWAKYKEDVENPSTPDTPVTPPTFMESLSKVPTMSSEAGMTLPTKEQFQAGARGLRDIYREYGRPTAEAGGMTYGAAKGAAAGAPLGPWGAGAGLLVGAGMGYAGSDKVSDLIESGLGYLAGEPVKDKGVGAELLESGQNVVRGAEYQAFGTGAGKFIFEPVFKGGRWTFRLIKSYFKKEPMPGINEVAAEMWVANTSTGPIYARNAEEAANLEGQIPGLKFTYGQKTYDPKEIKLERTQFRKPGEAGQQNMEQTSSNDTALREYYSKNFNALEGEDDFIYAVQQRQAALERDLAAAKETGSAAQARIAGKAKPADLLDTELRGAIELERDAANKPIRAMYDKLEEMNPWVPADTLVSNMKKIAALRGSTEDPANIPKVLNRVMSKYTDPKSGVIVEGNVSFKELRSLRTDILNEYRMEASKPGSNPEKIRRLELMRGEVEDAIDQLKDSGKFGEEAAVLYRTASSKYREYHDIFKKGVVADITQRGARGEVSRMTPEQLLRTIFNKNDVTAADQLTKAIGSEKAKELVTQYASYDLLKSAVNPVTREVNQSTVKAWLGKNRRVLEKYGLESEFDDIAKATANIDRAGVAVDAFEKSMAARALKADPEKVIGAIFSGKGALNSAETARQLMDLVKGNPAAEEGLKKSFADYMIKRVETTARTLEGSAVISPAAFNKLYQQFSPAMRVLYQNEPGKIKTLLNMKEAYTTMLRNKVSPIGGGSDTAENLTQILGSLGAPIVTPRYAWVNAIRNTTRILQRHRNEMIDKVISKAVFNPDYAETLEWLARGYRVPEAEKRLSSYVGAIMFEESIRLKEEMQ